jgi:hypothetical protein
LIEIATAGRPALWLASALIDFNGTLAFNATME